jgi:hypothetical protein
MLQEDGTRKLWYPGLTSPTANTPAKRRYRVLTPTCQPIDWQVTPS